MSSRRIFPTWEEIEHLPTKLEPGERALALFLDLNLPSDYSIFVQPVLNGMHPDIVIVNPGWGLIVYEVKDWTLGPLFRRDGLLMRQTAEGPKPEGDPMSQSRHYAQELFRKYLGVEEATRQIGEPSNDFQLCLPAIYIHGPEGSDVESLFGKYSFGAGATNIVLHKQNLDLDRAVPWTRYRMPRSRAVTSAQGRALGGLDRWLKPIANQASAFVPKKLSSQQMRLTVPQQGDFRIRGVAGAGKSEVLARRAAKASEEGSVVVTCYNITMAHVLHDMIAKCGIPVDWKNVRVRHYHGLLVDIAQEAGLRTSHTHLTDETIMQAIMAGLPLRGFPARGIYIDEGQDFPPEWIDTLASLRSVSGELVLMADYRQGLYDRPRGADGRSLKLAKFHEGWRQLNKTYRLPWRIAYLLNDLAATENIGDEHDPPLSDYEDRPAQEGLLEQLSWTNFVSLEDALWHLNTLLLASTAHPSDIAVLVRSHDLGLRVVEAVESADLRYRPIKHVFGLGGGDSEESKRRKHAFWMGAGGLKACTIKSFKGWQVNNVILLWDDSRLDKDLAELYVALSRAHLSLDVLNLSRKYDRFSALTL
jgi:hypothetical protein